MKRERQKEPHTIRECIITHVVARAVCINEDQNSDIGRAIWRARVCRRLRKLHTNRPRDVAQQQRTRAEQIHYPPPHLDHQHGHHRRTHHAPTGNAHIDFLNCGAICQSDHVQQVAQVVRDERVAAPLGKEAEHDGDEQAAAHAGRGEEGYPGGSGALLGLGLALDGESGVDLGDFGLDEVRVWVALGVVGGEDLVGFFEAVVGDEPAR